MANKTFVCIEDRVFFNKRIYNYGDVVTVTDDLAKQINMNWFETKEDFDKKQQIVVEKIVSAKKSNKTVDEVIEESEKEKKAIKKEMSEKIQELEKKLADKEIAEGIVNKKDK